MALSYGSSIVRDGLFLHYDFANIKSYPGFGNTVYDISGTGLNTTKGQYRYFTNQNGGELVGQGISGSDILTVSGIFGNYYTTDLTVSIWARFDRFTGRDIIRQYVSPSLGWLVSVDANNKLYLNGRDGVSGYFTSTKSSTVMKQNIIYNIVFVKSGNLWRLFVNGEEEISNFLGVSSNINANDTLQIGTGNGYPHSLYDFKMYNRALSTAEVKQNYNALKGRFVSEIDSDLIIDLNPNDVRSYSGSGTSFIDISANSNTALMINGPIFGSDGYTNYWKFDGVNDYATVSSTPTVFEYNRNSFTISCWAWYDVLESPIYKSGLLSKWTVGGGTNNEFLFIVNGSSSTNNYYYVQLDFDDGLSADNGVNATIVSTSKVNLKFWRLATFTFDNGLMRMYIDGNLEASQITPNSKVRRDTSSSLEIARWFSSIYGSGRRGQIQFYNRALTSTEISNLFNSQRQKYRLLNNSYMKNCVLNFDFGIEGTYNNSGTTVFDLARYNNGTLTNGPTYSFDNRGYIILDGVNDFILVNDDASIRMNSKNFTVSFWFYATGNGAATSNVIVSKRTSNGSAPISYGVGWGSADSGTTNYLVGHIGFTDLSNINLNSTIINKNQWYMCTFTWDGTNARLYVNDALNVTASSSNKTIYDDTFAMRIGSYNGSTRFFGGRIAHLLILNKEMSLDEIRSHYTDTLPRFTTDEKPVRGLVFDVNVSNPFSYNGASNNTGANLSDISGNGYIGTLNNAPTYNVQNGIKSLQFNGSNNYISYPTAGLPYGGSIRTMSVWLTTSTVDLTFGFAIAYGTGTIAQSYFIGRYGSNISVGTYGYDYNVTTSARINTWYHIVAVFDGTNLYGYLNGYLAISGPATANTIASRFNIGRQTNDSQYWNGKVGEAQIYNRALSANEVLALYNTTKGAYGF